jgi:hypothetical protein
LTAINPTNIRVGSNQPFGEYINASIDEVRFYKRVLTSVEVVTDMNTPLGPASGGSALRWFKNQEEQKDEASAQALKLRSLPIRRSVIFASLP